MKGNFVQLMRLLFGETKMTEHHLLCEILNHIYWPNQRKCHSDHKKVICFYTCTGYFFSFSKYRSVPCKNLTNYMRKPEPFTI